MFHPQESMNYHEIMFKDFSRYASKYDEVDEKQDPFFIYLRTVLNVLKNKMNHNIKDEQITSGIKEVAKFMRDIKEYAGISKDANIKQITTTTVVEKLQQWTDEQFENKAPINWLSYLGKIFNKSGARVDLKTNIYVNSNYVYNVLNITRNTDPAVLKNFALIRILLYSSFDGDRKIRTALFNYYKARNHTIPSRPDYCANQILDISSDGLVGLSLAASRLFTEEKRQMKAKSLVEKISESFKNKLLTSNWMDNKSKAAAMKKKENMISLVGVPDFVGNNKQLNEFYENLRISSQDNYGNMQQLRAFRQNYSFSRLRRPRVRSYWDKSPFETNALYNRANNKFIIPLALLYPPFFRGDFGIMDYSHLGVLVGHETTHGFDNAGRKYDAFGVIGNLWTNETYSAFENRSQCFREQYDRYFINELNKTLSGERSLNENLADNGGLKIAYNAAKEVFKFYSFESDKFSPEQLFFIGFATTFCSVEDLPYLEYTIDKGYPPSKYRVNGAVSNMKEFSDSFNCPKNSAMNPEEKCSLW
ncbi:hypothetical protein WA026_002766 [Henosepilachna vigintioctopunctata]|uniref:Uncharacterized protein n=2 Tax=Henosepilachna vigintioctopunctata TaxID=420089 RepID=A0AAW1U198_9CUCU